MWVPGPAPSPLRWSPASGGAGSVQRQRLRAWWQGPCTFRGRGARGLAPGGQPGHSQAPVLRRAGLLRVLLPASLNVTISAQGALAFTSNRASTRDFLDLSVRAVWSLSRVRLFATPRTVARQASSSVGFPRREHRSGLPFPSPGDLPNPGIEPRSPALAGGFFTTGSPWEAHALNVRPTPRRPWAGGGSPPPEAAGEAGLLWASRLPTGAAVPAGASHPWARVQAPGVPFWTSGLAGRLP